MSESTSANPLLVGETLVWVTYDQERVVSAALRVMLLERLAASGAKLDCLVAKSLDDTLALAEQHRAGLATFVCNGAEDEPSLWRALRRLQLRRPQCIRVVHIQKNVTEAADSSDIDRLRLMETGAQLVVEEIPWYRQALEAMLAAAPRRVGGNHPLTVGLIDRLPWA